MKSLPGMTNIAPRLLSVLRLYLNFNAIQIPEIQTISEFQRNP